MRQVAQAAGLTLGALYNHHANKDALFEEVFRTHSPFGLIPEALEGAAGDDAEALFLDAARRLKASVEARPDVVKLVFIEVLEFNGRHIPAIVDDNGPIVLAFARRCRAVDPRLAEVPPHLLMRTFLGLLTAWFMADAFFAGKMPLNLSDLRVEDAVGIFVHGALRAPSQAATDATPSP